MQVHQEVDLLVADLLQCLLLLRQWDEFDVALTQEGVRRTIDARCEHAHLEKWPLRPAEHEAHADHQQYRQQQGEHQRAAVAQELEVARVQGREQTPHHGRSSVPVRSRRKSSKFAGRVRR